MNDSRDQDPNLDTSLDARLSELMSDSVSDVEPGDGLDSIRSRTKVTPMSPRRPWLYATGGAVLATAAVITAIAFAGDNLGLTRSDDPGLAGQSPTGATQASESPTEQPSPSSTASTEPPVGEPVALPVYYVGDTPRGPRLYREFRRSSEAGDAISQAVDLAVSAPPLDPDYRSSWPDGARGYASYDGDVITVTLETADGGGPGLGLHDRPSGMSEAEAAMAIQQVIYTVQGALQQGRPAVQFLIDGQRTDQVLGVPTSEPLANAPVLDTLALVSITSPEERASATGTLKVSGVANSFEANVPWQILKGDQVVKGGSTMADGAYGNQLYPWQDEIDISELAPGEYTFRAQTDDPSGGEGGGPDVDTRTIVVE